MYIVYIRIFISLCPCFSGSLDAGMSPGSGKVKGYQEEQEMHPNMGLSEVARDHDLPRGHPKLSRGHPELSRGHGISQGQLMFGKDRAQNGSMMMMQDCMTSQQCMNNITLQQNNMTSQSQQNMYMTSRNSILSQKLHVLHDFNNMEAGHDVISCEASYQNVNMPGGQAGDVTVWPRGEDLHQEFSPLVMAHDSASSSPSSSPPLISGNNTLHSPFKSIPIFKLKMSGNACFSFKVNLFGAYFSYKNDGF